ncbi:MAG: aldehyde ferredoxin oxidoreductase family protein [Deltaproteobacteria bacterium]|nr:aldehyde ferredoxin oxidoreductase family protein [Deltaproteobacteria bacterium]
MQNGYWNKILRVDLTDRKILREELPESKWKKVIGGAGYGAKILYEEVPPDVKPYDQKNRLIFAVGPIQATKVTGTAKFSIVSRSPLTGIYGDTAAGGNWGITLKKAGYDALVIQGKASEPVYLWIDDDEVTICNAENIWGKDAYETNDAILHELGKRNISVACIGQAGERMVGIACVAIEKHSFGARCGIGAVMGSKNLKAVVVRGTKTCPLYDPEEVLKLSKDLNKTVYEATHEWFRAHGTPFVVTGCEEAGDLPIKNWAGDTWKEGAQKIGTPNYTEVLDAKPWPCKFCVIGCHRRIKFDQPVQYAVEGAGPEYETLGMLGASCLIDDVKAIAKANDLCNRYGVDTISAGAFVAFTMECYEKGLLTEKDTEGLSVNWGNADAMIEMIHQIGKKEGLGELFANGIVPAAQKIGKGAEEIAMHVKGLDMPAHDARAYFSLALNYATGNRGCCHERGNPQVASMGPLLAEAGQVEVADPHTMEKTEFLAAKYQDYGALCNSICFCKFMLFGSFGLTGMLNCLNATTGWNWTMEDFLNAGERIFTLQRMVNVRYGVSRKDDKLPKRVFQPAKEGSRAGKAPQDFEQALDRYYRLRGWDGDGRPTKEKIDKLGI